MADQTVQSRGKYFRDLIYNEMQKLTTYDNDFQVLYYYDVNKIPYMYLKVQDENQSQEIEFDGTGIGEIDLKDNVNFMLRVYYKVKNSKTQHQELNELGDLWIERIYYLLKKITLPTPFFKQTMFDGTEFYRCCVNQIDLQNRRTDLLKDSNVMELIIEGKLHYNITYNK